ncbi:MAG TPA: alpha/beta hydrolase, partial [Blastocatellia bacterium]|nr:alpha/beta hydrolase [Blastocatellia bacterium]
MHRRNVLKAAATAAIGAGMGLSVTDQIKGERLSAQRSTKTLIEMPFLRIDNRIRLFFKEWGKGRPVVFIHGWAMNAEMWQYQMIHLADRGMHCIAYDRRGHGRSSDPGTGYDYDTLADDLAVLLNQLDLRNVTLVGHSMASGEIVRYLTRHGASRVSKAVMIATTTPFSLKTTDNPEGVDKAYFEQIRGAMLKDFPKWLYDNARPFFTPETSPEMIQWGVTMCQQASLKAVIELNRVVTETDFRSELSKITVPALIIHGDKDVSAPLELTARRTAKLIPKNQLKVYEGGPHGLFITHKERLNRDL